MTVSNDCISSSDVYLLMQTRFCRWQHLLTAQEVCMKRKKSLPTSAFSWIPKNFYWNWATYRWSMYEQKKSLPTPAFSCISKNFCWNWATYGLEQSETDFVYLTPSWLNLLPVSNREIWNASLSAAWSACPGITLSHTAPSHHTNKKYAHTKQTSALSCKRRQRLREDDDPKSILSHAHTNNWTQCLYCAQTSRHQ